MAKEDDLLDADYVSDFMQTWETEKSIIDTLQDKYLTRGESISVEEVKRDAAFVGRVFRKYDSGKNGNIFLREQVRSMHKMLQRRQRQLKGKKSGKTKNVDQLFRKKGKDPVEQYLADTKKLGEKSQPEATPTHIVDLSTYRTSKETHGVGVITEPSDISSPDGIETLVDEVSDQHELATQQNEIDQSTYGNKPADEKPNRIIIPKRRIILHSDDAKAEAKRVQKGNDELSRVVEDILTNHQEEIIAFGREFNAAKLGEYLLSMFGPILYTDSLLTISQQYGLGNARIVNPEGSSVDKTAFSVSLFGDPGTGKSFALDHMIAGLPRKGIKAHGLIGKNRVITSMTPIHLVSIAEAYQGQNMNITITEFESLLRYKAMFDTLKLAMEGGEVSHETQRHKIPPYSFDAKFAVGYNTGVAGESYETKLKDPSFKAIEDRMIGVFHRRTEERERAKMQSKKNLRRGLISMDLAENIQRHLTLVYAITTGHDYVADLFPKKDIVLTPETDNKIEAAYNAAIQQIREASKDTHNISIPFSDRIYDRTIQLAGAMTLIGYFNQPKEDEVEVATTTIEIAQPALEYAIRFFVTEAAMRSNQAVDVDYTLASLNLDTVE